MKKIILFLFTCSVSFASEHMTTFDAFATCTGIGTRGYFRPSQYDVSRCVPIVQGKLFDSRAATICYNLPWYTYGYNVSASSGVDCFQTIAERRYTDSQIQYCQNLPSHSSGYVHASSVIDCLKI